MKLIAPETLNRIAANPANVTRTGLAVSIDHGRPWAPERNTQLYFAPLYKSLHFEHRLRYNQLSALRVNEYIMMLEGGFIDRLLTPLKRYPGVREDAALCAAIDVMIAEERRHRAGFAALNRLCRPDLYPPGDDLFFSRAPAWTKGLLWGVGAVAGRLSFALWYVMALEESCLAMEREMLRRRDTETLGPLDEGFRAVHVQHMKDEARHVHIDAHLIARTITAQTPARRRFNARMFGALYRAVTTPTRSGSGVKVIRQLVRDMPELKPREEEMIRAVMALRDDAAFHHSLFSRRLMPRTFEIFDSMDEMASLGDRMPGYDRR